MDDSAARTAVDWREWGSDAFAEADRRGQPVLLSLSARWCRYCREMDRETYDDPRIAATVDDAFVPVRVDVDRHPRVRERYATGGFPSTVFLTPAGEVLSGAGYLGPEGLRQVLESVRRTWDAEGTSAGRIPRGLADEATPAGELTPAIERGMVGTLRAAYDEVAGGWGDAGKFPMPRTIEFALKREREQALRALNAVSANLLDDYAGGFFRYAANRDWSDAHHEKLLDENAGLVRAFANGYLYTGRTEYRQPAATTVEYLTTTLWNEKAGAFAGSQAPGAPDYYRLEPTDREAREAPPIDPTPFADRNAAAVDALLAYHAVTDDDLARRYAERALQFLLRTLIEDDRVVHYRDPSTLSADDGGANGTGTDANGRSERGLLLDHARTIAALTRARQVLGPDVGGRVDADPLKTARALADYAVDTLQSGGAFRDGPATGPGLLARPLRPLDGTVEMADALVELSLLTGADRYRDAAREAVCAFAGAADRFGPRVAGYATVAARLLGDPLVIAVGRPPGSDLHRAALRVADHEKVVVPAAGADGVDPGVAVEPGRAVVRRGDAVTDPTDTPEGLSDRVTAVTEGG